MYSRLKLILLFIFIITSSIVSKAEASSFYPPSIAVAKAAEYENNKEYEKAKNLLRETLPTVVKSLKRKREELDRFIKRDNFKMLRDAIKRSKKILKLLEEEHLDRNKILEAFQESPESSSGKNMLKKIELAEKDPLEKSKLISKMEEMIIFFNGEIERGIEVLPKYEDLEVNIKYLEKLIVTIENKIEELEELTESKIKWGHKGESDYDRYP